jgi:hypothetical protein
MEHLPLILEIINYKLILLHAGYAVINFSLKARKGNSVLLVKVKCDWSLWKKEKRERKNKNNKIIARKGQLMVWFIAV